MNCRILNHRMLNTHMKNVYLLLKFNQIFSYLQMSGYLGEVSQTADYALKASF